MKRTKKSWLKEKLSELLANKKTDERYVVCNCCKLHIAKSTARKHRGKYYCCERCYKLVVYGVYKAWEE